MDMLKHGESAYPADAWVESQYRNSSNNETLNYVSNNSSVWHEYHILSFSANEKICPPSCILVCPSTQAELQAGLQ